MLLHNCNLMLQIDQPRMWVKLMNATHDECGTGSWTFTSDLHLYTSPDTDLTCNRSSSFSACNVSRRCLSSNRKAWESLSACRIWADNRRKRHQEPWVFSKVSTSRSSGNTTSCTNLNWGRVWLLTPAEPQLCHTLFPALYFVLVCSQESRSHNLPFVAP